MHQPVRVQTVPTALYVEFPVPFGKSYDAGKRRDYSQHLVSKVEDSSYASYFHIQWHPLVDMVASPTAEPGELRVLLSKEGAICAGNSLSLNDRSRY